MKKKIQKKVLPKIKKYTTRNNKSMNYKDYEKNDQVERNSYINSTRNYNIPEVIRLITNFVGDMVIDTSNNKEFTTSISNYFQILNIDNISFDNISEDLKNQIKKVVDNIHANAMTIETNKIPMSVIDYDNNIMAILDFSTLIKLMSCYMQNMSISQNTKKNKLLKIVVNKE